MNIIKLKITGTRPLLMHSDTLADPLNPKTKIHKSLTVKGKKTDEDHEAIAKSEWMSSLYLDESGPVIPGANIHAALIAGGKLSKLGAQLKRSTEVIRDVYRLDYTGPRDIESLWEKGFFDARTVKNPGSSTRIVRYRPMFREWSCEAEIAFDPGVINQDQVVKCMEMAGQYCGIGDYRPKFGRFNVEAI
jgi:hypothetical protein